MTELTPELLADLRVPGTPAFSPVDARVAYSVTPASKAAEHPVSAIWLAWADGSQPPRQLTSGQANDTQPKWSPAGDTLYFLSDRAERGKVQLYQLPLTGGEATALTTWAPGIASFLPLADGQTIALLARDPDSDEQQRRERERDDPNVFGEWWPYHRLRFLDLATGAIRTVTALGDRHVATFDLAPDQRQLAVITWPTPELDHHASAVQLWLVDSTSGAAEEIATLPAGANHLTWDRTGQQLVYIAPDRVCGNQLYRLALADRQPQPLAPDLAACPTFVLRQGDNAIVVLVAAGLDTTINRLDLATGTLHELQRLPGEALVPTLSADSQQIACLHSLPDQPQNLWAGPLAGSLQALTDLNPELHAVRWGSQERLAWQAEDGLALDGLLVLPPGKTRADGPFPLIVVAHGGPYGRFADDLQIRSGAPSAQWLAAGGYAVFLPNSRGGIGHGPAFAAAVAGRVGLEDWGDIVAGLNQLIEAGVADPDRLGIGGWSQGGFMTAWAVGQTDRFRCGVMGAGVSDWGMMVAESDLPIFESLLGGSTGWEGIGPHQHDYVSPISYIHQVQTPVLILHGERDERVPVGQAQFFARGLRQYGVPYELVVYPREPHGLRERLHQIDATRRLRAWYDRWLQ